MSDQLQTIPVLQLALAFVPVAVVTAIMSVWRLSVGHTLYAVFRMLMQLLLIGYVLTFIFNANNAGIVLGVLTVMLLASSWIALGVVKQSRRVLLKYALFAITLGGVLVLALVSQGVLQLKPWYRPDYMIPLAGMIFANAMTSISLAAERLGAELERGVPYQKARNIALHAAMIPLVNSLFAVGLVSLPGMMTGQILSGISPLIAARYQIMVMCMIFGSAGISVVCFLVWTRPVYEKSVSIDDTSPSSR